MLLPRLSSSLARGGEAECSTPDSGGSVGAARAAVLSTPGLRPCPRRARASAPPAAARARLGSQVRARPEAAGGEGGSGSLPPLPPRSRVSRRLGAEALTACRAPLGTVPGPGPSVRLRPERAFPPPAEFRAAAQRARSSGRSHAEVGARKGGRSVSGFLGPALGARLRGRRFPSPNAGRPAGGARAPRARAPASQRASRHFWEAKRESSKSGQGAGHFPAEGCACEERPRTSAFLPARAASPTASGPPRGSVQPAPPAPSSGPFCRRRGG